MCAHPEGHPKGRVIAFLWAGVFVLAFIGAAVFQDDDPATDDGAGLGALAGIAGGILTVVYVVGSSVLNGRRERRDRDAW